MSVESALEPLADALLADGYELRLVSAADGVARLAVVATDEACADCLVPKDVFTGIVRTRLAGTLGGTWQVELAYPDDAG